MFTRKLLFNVKFRIYKYYNGLLIYKNNYKNNCSKTFQLFISNSKLVAQMH